MKLKEWRERKGLRQADVAKGVGVSQVSIGRYERGRTPKPAVLMRIVKFTKGKVGMLDLLPDPEE